MRRKRQFCLLPRWTGECGLAADHSGFTRILAGDTTFPATCARGKFRSPSGCSNFTSVRSLS
jgi:hypothetical protein